MRDQRPSDMSPVQIGFTPQKPVPWLNPGLLAGTAVRVALAHLFGGYLDKRELQAVLPSAVDDHSGAEELWIDYVADLGDGFDATYSIAHLLARESLTVDGTDLPRADAVVLGGDQVYPTASVTDYENRFKGPYRAAFPPQPGQPSHAAPTMYAVPGNHDWYDGLTAFLRLFAQNDPIGGWQTSQRRSYFAVALPHRWWLLAIDVQLASYIDEPQLEYFRQVASQLGPDDRIVLCSAKPGWVQTIDDPQAYDNLDYFVRTVIEPTGARVPLLLAGDLHHYTRYAGDDTDGRPRHLVTCGGGGAYLVGTAHLPEAVSVPPETTTDREASKPRQYRLESAYPDRKRSRRLGRGILTKLPRRNPGFVALLGVMQTLWMLALLTADGGWLNGAVGVTGAGVVAGTLLFATALGTRGRRQWICGALHAVPHLALGLVGAAAWSALPLADAPSPWDTVLAFVVYLPVAGLVDTWIVGVYMLLARYVRVNVNELYAGMGITDYKSFVRMHIGTDGSLTLHPIAVERVCRRWHADPDAPAAASWIAPVEPLRPSRVEPPVTLS
ncbi:metallophosphoesterase [Haloactinopolyspora sp.]|uniref:metallophosphoesterase family protein n=1 Tax=Haloactinopolyspora sp. TaxID=1966353 RepID=UPI00261A1B96|nr:metallophosphoesterase [Haloactinopolyspora sp.]